MKKPFLSLKWKAVLLTSLLLSACIAFYSINNHFQLIREFEYQRRTTREMYARNLNAVVTRSLDSLQETGWLIATLAGFPDVFRSGEFDRFRAQFEDDWALLQISTSLDVLRCYDRNGHVVGAWGAAGRPVPQHSAASFWPAGADGEGRPVKDIRCEAGTCMQYVSVPVLVGGDRGGLVVVGSSLADIVLSFGRISGINALLLVSPSPTSTTTELPDQATIESWGARVVAGTNAPRSATLLQDIAARFPDFSRFPEGRPIVLGNRVYELAALPLPHLQPPGRAHVVAMADITEPYRRIQGATRRNVFGGVFALVGAELFLLTVAIAPIHRIKCTAQTLPLLAKGEFEGVRASIAQAQSSFFLRDEVDLLHDTAMTLTDRLESLAKDNALKTADLRDHLDQLAEERTFMNNLLDAAPVVLMVHEWSDAILLVNRYGEALTGYSGLELQTMTFGQLTSGGRQLADLDERLEELCLGVRTQLDHEGQIVCRDGSRRDMAWIHSCLPGHANTILSVGMDVTGRNQLAQGAGHDRVTGLFNRIRFEEEVRHALSASQRYQRSGALLILDLDDFKNVNDTHGHHTGDVLLTVVAHAITRKIRDVDVMGRLGGDEFGILLQESTEEGAVELARKINDELALLTSAFRQRVSMSIGIARFPEHATELSALFQAADMAMYRAKEAGRGSHQVYSPSQPLAPSWSSSWRTRIERAIADDRLALHYQPVCSVHEPAVDHFEALPRLVADDGAEMAPEAFLPPCERAGVRRELDHAMIRKVLKDLSTFGSGRNDCVALTLSPQSFAPDLLPLLQESLADCPVSPERLVFQISHASVNTAFPTIQETMRQLHGFGCRVGIDSFGAGVFSFHELRDLPVDYVKVSGGLVRGLATDPASSLALKTSSLLAQGFGRKLVAVEVDSPAVLEALEPFGIDYVRGAHLGDALPPDKAFDPDGRSRGSASSVGGYDLLIV